MAQPRTLTWPVPGDETSSSSRTGLPEVIATVLHAFAFEPPPTFVPTTQTVCLPGPMPVSVAWKPCFE